MIDMGLIWVRMELDSMVFFLDLWYVLLNGGKGLEMCKDSICVLVFFIEVCGVYF